MAESTAIDKFFDEANAVVQLLQEAGQLSLQVTAADHFRKARQRSKGSLLIQSLVKNKAVSRQYHTWFSWDKRNANQFFGLFGDEFRRPMISRVEASPALQKSIHAFLEIGNERNKLVHENYVGFALEKTLDEIYQLHKDATLFVETLLSELLNCDPFEEPDSNSVSI